jgi:N-acetyltransferase 10
MSLVDCIAEKSVRHTVSLTAARGRGKSAAVGLAVAAALSKGLANIFVTAPAPENLKTFFEFVLEGLEALGYKENLHYDLVQSTNPDFNSAVIRVNVFKTHRQVV